MLKDASEERVHSLLAALAGYGDAIRQRIHPQKASVLLLGSAKPAAPHMAPLAIAGIPVRDQVVTLGVPFADGGDPQPDWGGTSATSQPTAAYDVSKLLYRAEFCRLPEEEADGLCCMTTKLVDRGQAPGCRKRALPGVPTDMLAGRPADEGFGAMAWQEHIALLAS
eukprot:362063-Chlamydomonas_euryale.AAC.1